VLANSFLYHCICGDPKHTHPIINQAEGALALNPIPPPSANAQAGPPILLGPTSYGQRAATTSSFAGQFTFSNPALQIPSPLGGDARRRQEAARHANPPRPFARAGPLGRRVQPAPARTHPPTSLELVLLPLKVCICSIIPIIIFNNSSILSFLMLRLVAAELVEGRLAAKTPFGQRHTTSFNRKGLLFD
jgi:hypothetical protein